MEEKRGKGKVSVEGLVEKQEESKQVAGEEGRRAEVTSRSEETSLSSIAALAPLLSRYSKEKQLV